MKKVFAGKIPSNFLSLEHQGRCPGCIIWTENERSETFWTSTLRTDRHPLINLHTRGHKSTNFVLPGADRLLRPSSNNSLQLILTENTVHCTVNMEYTIFFLSFSPIIQQYASVKLNCSYCLTVITALLNFWVHHTVIIRRRFPKLKFLQKNVNANSGSADEGFVIETMLCVAFSGIWPFEWCR